MTPPISVERDAPAKLNLCLAVDLPDATGMHPIASWMAPISLRDRVTVTRLRDGHASLYNIDWAADAPRRATIDWPIVKDLAVRAHLLLEREAGVRLPVRLRVEKRVPVGAGLGGGSSDAAAALLAVREAFGLDVDDARLRTLAQELGSDVAFFLGEGPALVEGLGDRIEPAPAVRAPGGGAVWAAVFVPAFACATGAVYRAFDAVGEGHVFRSGEAGALARAGVAEGDALFNDLASAAERVAGELAGLRAHIAEAVGAPAHVTGSGSGMYAVFGSEADAEGAAEACERAGAGCAAIVVRVG